MKRPLAASRQAPWCPPSLAITKDLGLAIGIIQVEIEAGLESCSEVSSVACEGVVTESSCMHG